MKYVTTLLTILATLALTEIPEAAASCDLTFPGAALDNPLLKPKARKSKHPKTSNWTTYRYSLFEEEVEVALPQKYTFSNNNDLLVLQFEKAKESYSIVASTNDGEPPTPEQIYVAVVDASKSLVEEYGGQVGDPVSWDRDDLDVTEVLIKIPTPAGTVYSRTSCYVSDDNIYWLSVTYISAPSANVDKFFQSFRLIQ